jgi:two-component system cell cycle response regulator
MLAGVSTLRQSFTDLLNSLREPRDELLLELGADGEVLLARLRLAIACVLVLLPAVNYAAGGGGRETLIGFIGVGLSIILSQVWLGIARRRRRYAWLPYVSTAFDVSIVTLVLLMLAFHDPAAGLNSVVVWCIYPLVVMASALRNNVRVTLFTGALAIFEFLLVSFIFQAVSDGPIHSEDYGTVAMSTQLQRALLLFATTVVTMLIVFRMQRLVQMSGTDGLTGLPNRSYLNHRIPRILADARLVGDTVCLALLDLDFFKRINDELGHQAGDRALRHVVDVLRLELRRDEPMLRVGGEEFVVLLKQPLGAGWERMDGLRRRLQAVPFDPGEGHEIRNITVSCGVACSPDDAIDVSGLMRSADLRLRMAKQAGRNRVVARDSG